MFRRRVLERVHQVGFTGEGKVVPEAGKRVTKMDMEGKGKEGLKIRIELVLFRNLHNIHADIIHIKEN